jgi:hypothetical protein
MDVNQHSEKRSEESDDEKKVCVERLPPEVYQE